MSRVLPILFNTDMVRAILDGRKTVTRRKIPIDVVNYCDIDTDGTLLSYENDCGDFIEPEKLCQYKQGDILYVRETWSELSFGYAYKADGENIDHLGNLIKWHPSIHMPKEAARIWLKVKDVRVERLQEITEEQLRREGFIPEVQGHFKFKWTWNSTIKKSELDRYGWVANPFIWVIEFERCEKPEGWCV